MLMFDIKTNICMLMLQLANPKPALQVRISQFTVFFLNAFFKMFHKNFLHVNLPGSFLC